MNILFLSSWFPYPPDNGSKIRIFNLLRQLSKKHSITLLSFVQEDFKKELIEPLKKYCGEIIITESRPFNPKSLKALAGYFGTAPRSLVETYSEKMQDIFNDKIQKGKYDLLICTQFSTILYAHDFKKAPKIFEEIEVSVLKDNVKKEGFRSKLTWWKLKKFIKKILMGFDGYTVVSLREKMNISEISGSSNCEIIPNGIDLSDNRYSYNAKAENLIYSGALTYGANFDAMQYFLEKIFPLIKKQIPEIKIKITGSVKGVDTARLQLDQNTELTGYVDDIRSLLTNSAVCVVPLRIGGGTRLKVLEAMALGIPVVSTSKGAEGIEGLKPIANYESRITNHDFNIWIENEPAKFAQAAVELSKNRAFAGQMAINARKLVEEKYDWDKIGEKYEIFIKSVIKREVLSGT